jgi:hypothetical protein
VGRLENIIARNRRDGRPRERVVVSLIFGGIVLLILGLMVFTDLGASPQPAQPADPGSAASAPVPARHEKHVDGVLLRKPPARRPPQPAAP